MTTSTFFMPSVNMFGAGCLKDAAGTIKSYGYQQALIVTDKVLNKIGVVAQVQALLAEMGVKSAVYDGTKPNPTTTNVAEGLAILKEHRCDCVISLGGGSPHVCAKGIALVAANGGEIKDYEGVDRSPKPQLPLISINTTAGTAAAKNASAPTL